MNSIVHSIPFLASQKHFLLTQGEGYNNLKNMNYITIKLNL